MRRGIDGELKDEYCCPTGDGERSGGCRGGVRRDEEAKERGMTVQYCCPTGALRLAWNAAQHPRREAERERERERERWRERRTEGRTERKRDEERDRQRDTNILTE